MTKALKEAKLEAHLDAIEKHKALLEKLQNSGSPRSELNDLQALAEEAGRQLKRYGYIENT